ncbi:uncharacterized protein METZ01_LOCUS103734 [marine metagenome]|uniref:Uncharacterized protein n=1 Tax=marine metagenome TaxID=408172 RepID=A0A381WEB9_9ZZZZ
MICKKNQLSTNQYNNSPSILNVTFMLMINILS